MRTITEALVEVEDIINYNMETLHKLAEVANTIAKGNLKEQESLAKSIACLWNYLKPVHRWIREQNPTQEEFYNELDKYLAAQANPVVEVKSVGNKKKGKK